MLVCVNKLSSRSTKTNQQTRRVSKFRSNQTDVVKVDVLNKLIDSNGENFKKIKATLALMKIDTKDCEAT